MKTEALEQKEPLSDIPSEMILQALEDIESCEKHPGYKIMMGDWHWWNDAEKVCEVCMAGASMARRGGHPAEEYLEWGVIRLDDPVTTKKMSALDDFRFGEIGCALMRLRIGLPDGIDDERDVCDYGKDPAQFKKDMRKIASDLSAAGI